jgi:hypothetical protein
MGDPLGHGIDEGIPSHRFDSPPPFPFPFEKLCRELIISNESITEILRLPPQNDIKAKFSRRERKKWDINKNPTCHLWDVLEGFRFPSIPSWPASLR